MAILTLLTMLRPTTPTRRLCRSAISMTCWTREMLEAKVATMTRPLALEKMRSKVSPISCSEWV